MTRRLLRQLRRHTRLAVPFARGSVLIYVIAVMTVFGLLGAAMMAMFSSATMMSTGTPNYARQARYMAESGMRYAVSELRNQYSPSTVSRLNSTDYVISGTGSFSLNVFGRWFEAASTYGIASGDVDLNIPEGEVPKGFSLPVNLHLLNLEGFRDAKNFGGDPENFVAVIQSAPDMAADPLTVSLGDSFIVDQNQAVLPAVMAADLYGSSGLTVPADGTLQVDAEAGSVFPETNGSFYFESTLNEKKRYFYKEMVPGDPVQLTNISEEITVHQDDWVALTEQNHIVSAKGASGGAGAGGSQELAMDFRPNITAPQPVPIPPPFSLPPDVAPSDFVSDDTATPESAASAVTVDTGTGTIDLGGNVGTASGAVWFGGDVNRGGLNICTGGKCGFFDGIRAFFIFDYTGTGEGFTFTLANGAVNNTDAYGGTQGTIGYAGTSPTGKQISKPKMAVEFDTYSNDLRNDPDDAAWSNRDMIQYVYWGSNPATDATGQSDDNIHDTGGEAGEKWPPHATTQDVRSKPAIDSAGTALYVNAKGDLYKLDPDTGNNLFPLNYFNPYAITTVSSPTLDSFGSVIMGEDYGGGSGYIDAINTDGSDYVWYYWADGAVNSSPAIDSSGVIYFGTDKGYFYAYDNNGSSASPKWASPFTISGGPEIKGAIALSPDESAVYFVTKDPGTLYALYTSSGNKKWEFSLNGRTESSPRVGGDGTIYVGSEDNYLYAVTDNGTSASQKWRYQTGGSVKSRPAVGPDGTVYVGSDDDKLHAVNPDGTGKWAFTESDTGNVKGSPMVHDDGTIWFGSDGGAGNGYFYVLDPEGDMIDRYDLGGNVQCEATQGPDGAVYVGSDDNYIYAFTSGCQPRNQKSLYYTSDDLPADVTVADPDDWLNSGPWAVRLEITRSRTLNDRNKYEYTLKMWLRQCSDLACTEDTADPANAIKGTYFEDTRIAYGAKNPYLTQTVELCPSDQAKFDTFIFGFTEATGSAVQSITITDTQLGFIRPGDFTITNDPNWQ